MRIRFLEDCEGYSAGTEIEMQDEVAKALVFHARAESLESATVEPTENTATRTARPKGRTRARR